MLPLPMHQSGVCTASPLRRDGCPCSRWGEPGSHAQRPSAGWPKVRMLQQSSMCTASHLQSACCSCCPTARPHSHAQEPSSSLQEVGTSSSGHSHTLQSRSMHMLSSGQKGQSHQRLTCRVGHQHISLQDVPGVLSNRVYFGRHSALTKWNPAQPDTTTASPFAGK